MPKGVQQILLGRKTPQGIDANTILCLHCDGADASTAFPDASGYTPANTVTANGHAKVGTAQFKFGTASFSGDGTTGCCLTVAPSSNFNFGSADFTIDFWFWPASTTVAYYLFEKANANTAPFWGPIQIVANSTGSGRVGFWLSSTGTSWDIGSADGGAVVTANTWNHYALVRHGTNFTGYLNGVANGTVTSAASLVSNALPIAIGGMSDLLGSGGYLNGFIDEYRISNISRWTSGFSPPAAPYS